MLTADMFTRAGAHQAGLLATTALPFDAALRQYCENNLCRHYGTTWACPPAVGTVEQCRARCLAFANAMVFNAVYPLEDSFDYEGMAAGHKAFKALCDTVDALVRQENMPYLLLSNEGCGRCAHCTYPDAPCRLPDRLFPSLEGFGLHVSELAARAGLSYVNGANTVTYFGMLLY